MVANFSKIAIFSEKTPFLGNNFSKINNSGKKPLILTIFYFYVFSKNQRFGQDLSYFNDFWFLCFLKNQRFGQDLSYFNDFWESTFQKSTILAKNQRFLMIFGIPLKSWFHPLILTFFSQGACQTVSWLGYLLGCDPGKSGPGTHEISIFLIFF